MKQEGGILTWEITRADIGDKAGSGQAQITIRDADGTVIKTAIACTRVSESLGDATAPAPDPVTTWIDKATGTLADVKRAGNAAQAVADEVQRRLDNGDFVGPQGPQGVKGEPGKDAVIDATLTQEGAAADAATTGKRLSEIEKAVAEKADKARQNILIGSETGNTVSVSDAFSAPLCGLTVYGRSTQDGTPTPDAPVPIVSAGDGGSVEVKATGKNLFPVVTGANVSKINKPGGGVRYGYVFHVPVESSVTVSGNADIYTNCFVGDFDIKTQTYTQKALLISEKGGTSATTLQSGWYVVYVANDYLPSILIKLNDAKIQLEIGAEATAYEPYCEQLLTLPTPNGLPGIPVTSGGNYTDQNGQQWVCDEVDLERGVKVQRVDKAAFDSTKTLVEQNAILATPVETPLTPAEIADYKALTAYAPDTVVQAADGAGLKLDYQRDVNIAIKNLEDAIASMTTT